MDFPVLELDECIIIELPEEMDISNADAVRDQLCTVLERGVPGLVLDMRKTTFCDSTGAEAIVGVNSRAHALGTWVRLVVRAGIVRKVLHLLNIDQFIPVSITLAGAMASTSDDVVPI